MVAVYQSFAEGDLERARAEQKRLDFAREAMGSGGSLALLKAVAEWRGATMGGVRAPLPQVSAETTSAATEKLLEVGVQPAADNLHVAAPAA